MDATRTDDKTELALLLLAPVRTMNQALERAELIMARGYRRATDYHIVDSVELDAMPAGTVIIDATGTAYQRATAGTEPAWEEPGRSFPEPITHPVTVLHIPLVGS